MQDFIVLGQIPGTQTYFNFSQLMFFLAGCLSLFIIIKLWRRMHVRYLAWRVSRLIRDYEFAPFAISK